MVAARTFSIRCRKTPAWVGLLAMLEDFAQCFDDPEAVPQRASNVVFIRDGWRCQAPGCTSGRNLHQHHLTYRSTGGGEGLENRTTACAFHHLRGEHGDLASCRGEAPLGITWRLGSSAKPGLTSWFRNEMRAE